LLELKKKLINVNIIIKYILNKMKLYITMHEFFNNAM
jgi:hypothetical protein